MHVTRRLPESFTSHPLFTREEERAAFQALADARAAAWAAVLSDRRIAPRCLPAVAATLPEHVVWDAAREAAVMRPTAAHLAAFTDATAPLAQALAALHDDRDLGLLRSAVAEVGRLAPRRGTPDAWVRRVGAAMAAVHAALEHVERHNVRLVVSVAARYAAHANCLDLHDLVGHGCVGLRTAALRYDLSRGFRFSTSAQHWIRHEVRRAVQDLSREIRLPVHLLDRVGVVSRLVDRAVSETGVAPSVDDVLAQMPATTRRGKAAAVARSSVEAALEVVAGGWRTSSLDQPFHAHDGGPGYATLRDTLPDENARDPVDAREREQRVASLRGMLDVLTPVERFVVGERFGLATDEPAQLREIGKVLGVCHERVRQIEASALKKMRLAAGLTRSEADVAAAQAPRRIVTRWRSTDAEQVTMAL